MLAVSTNARQPVLRQLQLIYNGIQILEFVARARGHCPWWPSWPVPVAWSWIRQ